MPWRLGWGACFLKIFLNLWKPGFIQREPPYMQGYHYRIYLGYINRVKSETPSLDMIFSKSRVWFAILNFFPSNFQLRTQSTLWIDLLKLNVVLHHMCVQVTLYLQTCFEDMDPILTLHCQGDRSQLCIVIICLQVQPSHTGCLRISVNPLKYINNHAYTVYKLHQYI